MDTLSYKTVSAKKENEHKNWYVVDAEGLVVGRLATQIAHILRGKHKPEYTPHVDCGDFVIVLNADKLRFTGNKWNNKEYIWYTGYPGGQRTRTAKVMKAKKPHAIIESAVRGMLPKNKLGRSLFRKLFVYTGAEHPHSAQKPIILNID